MRNPDIAKTQVLWCESVTSHGTADKKDATGAPRPTNTKRDGSAQQSSVPNDVNRDK